MSAPKSYLTHLACALCEQNFEADRLQSYCQACHSPLLAQYDLDAIRAAVTPEQISKRAKDLWRWAELLPVRAAKNRLTLGEGSTPLLRAARLGAAVGLPNLYIKDESANPTGTFKARGLVMAVSRGIELGAEAFVIPTAGNAGGALAAYAAAAGKQAHVFMPQDAPKVNQVEVSAYGADLHLVDGLINEAGAQAAAEAQENGWFDVSTFKEPYRAEGKKTMGLELAEQFGWVLPDVIVYPTGGGTGLVGMWKAFEELEKMGWIGHQRPRMVSVQAAGCAPIVRAFEQGDDHAEAWTDAETYAAGLRVPLAFADRLILAALYESEGTAITVTDEEMQAAVEEMAHQEGLFAAPEGAATWAALKQLMRAGWLQADERVVLFNTGSGLKYIQ